MPKQPDPNPKPEVLTSSGNSPMQFMKEYLIYDEEVDGLVRFRGPFIVPDWTGVEDGERDYVIDRVNERLDVIAFDFLGSAELHWVIAARNHLDLPDVQLYKGRKLKIPARDWVERVLLPQGAQLRRRD